MKKPVHKNRKRSAKFYNRLIIGAVALTVALIIALVVANAIAPGEYIVTADGHVHTADGTHVGDATEMFGEGYTVSEDGHVHDANGNHVATYDAASEDAAVEATAEPTSEPVTE